MFGAPKPLAGYTTLKRKWQDSTDEGDSNAEESDLEDVDSEELDSSEDDLDVSSLVSVLESLKGNSQISPSQMQKLQTSLQALLQSFLPELRRVQTTTKELVDAFSSLISNLG